MREGQHSCLVKYLGLKLFISDGKQSQAKEKEAFCCLTVSQNMHSWMEQRILARSVADVGEHRGYKKIICQRRKTHGPNGPGMVKRQQQRPAKRENDGTEEQQDCPGCQSTKSPMAQAGHYWSSLCSGCEGQLLTGT